MDLQRIMLCEEVNPRRLHTAWFHLQNTPETDEQMSGCQGLGRGGGREEECVPLKGAGEISVLIEVICIGSHGNIKILVILRPFCNVPTVGNRGKGP